MATGAEETIVDTWFRYETRVHLRTALEIGAFHPLLACSIGGIDLFTLVREGTLFVPPDEFCDDKPLSVFNECFLECDFNLLQSQCPEAKPGCGDCIKEHLKTAQEHYPVYYRDYVQTVLTDVVVPLQAAGALNWRESAVPGNGALVAPIMSLDPETVLDVITDFNTRIIPEAVAEDPRAAVYYSQAGILNDPCLTSFPDLGVGLPGLPGAFDPTAPGLAALEMYKTRDGRPGERRRHLETHREPALDLERRRALSEVHETGGLLQQPLRRRPEQVGRHDAVAARLPGRGDVFYGV